MKDIEKISLYNMVVVNTKEWEEIKTYWKEEYEKYKEEDYEEDYEYISPQIFPIFKDIIDSQSGKIQIFSLKDKEGKSQVLFQSNIANLPKYTSEVLRIRNIIFSPIWNFNEKELDDHSKLWGELFSDIANFAIKSKIKNVKIHVNSPYEAKILFAYVAKSLEEKGILSNVKDYGAWVDFSIK